jgi:hypothetical protein
VLPDPALTTGAVRTTDMAGVCTDRHTRQYRHWSRERADRILQEYKVHQRAGVPLDPYLNTRRLGEVTENLCGLSLGELCAVEINADRNTAIGGARQCLHNGPVRQDIGGHVDFILGAIDQGHVDVFQVFRRRVVNGRRRIGAARRERGEQETSRNAGAPKSFAFLLARRLEPDALPVV